MTTEEKQRRGRVLTWTSFWWLVRRSLLLAYQNNCFGVAKAAAYSALLSFFPLLTATAAILVQARAQPVSRLISRALSHALPPGTEDLVLNHFRFHGERPTSLLVAATLVSIWGASRVITSLMDGFQASYHIPVGRPFLRHQGIAILLVLAAAVPAVIASALVLFGARIEQHVLGWLGVIPVGAELEGWVLLLGTALRYVVAFGTIVLVTTMLYYVAPNRPQQWGRVFPGALVATVLWMIATLLFAWYFRDIAEYNLLYGSVGAVIALLVWMYVLSAIALVGCEFNAEYERLAVMRE